MECSPNPGRLKERLESNKHLEYRTIMFEIHAIRKIKGTGAVKAAFDEKTS
jgi:hypothetical protein